MKSKKPTTKKQKVYPIPEIGKLVWIREYDKVWCGPVTKIEIVSGGTYITIGFPKGEVQRLVCELFPSLQSARKAAKEGL